MRRREAVNLAKCQRRLLQKNWAGAARNRRFTQSGRPSAKASTGGGGNAPTAKITRQPVAGCRDTVALSSIPPSLEGGGEQDPCCSRRVPGFDWLAASHLDPGGYRNSYTCTCAVVGCRVGKPGDQLHSTITVATPSRAPGCTNMMQHLYGLRILPNGADELAACSFYCTSHVLPT
jgi:hypothetical protein